MSYFHFDRKDLEKTLKKVIVEDHQHLVGFLTDVLVYHNCDEQFLKVLLGIPAENTKYLAGSLVDINTTYVVEESDTFSMSQTGTVKGKIVKVLPFNYQYHYLVEFVGKTSSGASQKITGKIREHGIVVPPMDLLE